MTAELISRGLAAASDTSVVEVGRGVLSASGTILKDSLFADGKAALVVADERTWAAAGKAVHESLVAAGVEVLDPMIFPGHPVLYAALENCDIIRERLADSGALGVAVGSGTINDLVKLASGQLGQPYAVVGTAASMDGYSGFGAPMSSEGVKVTMPCPAPLVVIIDLDVAAAAPPSMVASGYGDLSAKIPAGADWILSDAVGLDPIDPLAWELVQSGVSDALSRPDALAAGDPDAYAGLVSGLVLSGPGDAGLSRHAAGLRRRALLQPPLGARPPRGRLGSALVARPQGGDRNPRDERVLRAVPRPRPRRARHRRGRRALGALGRRRGGHPVEVHRRARGSRGQRDEGEVRRRGWSPRSSAALRLHLGQPCAHASRHSSYRPKRCRGCCGRRERQRPRRTSA